MGQIIVQNTPNYSGIRNYPALFRLVHASKNARMILRIIPTDSWIHYYYSLRDLLFSESRDFGCGKFVVIFTKSDKFILKYLHI